MEGGREREGVCRAARREEWVRVGKGWYWAFWGGGRC